MRSLICLFLGGLAVGWTPSAAAEPEAMGIASRLAVEVTEVVTGGTWIDGAASGAYRTVTVQTSAPEETVDIFIQWIGTRSAAEPPQIISSVPLREVNALKLATASITLESEVEGIAKIIVAGQDASGRTAGLVTFVATTPGRYEALPPDAAEGARK